jgi:hypothetical protein
MIKLTNILSEILNTYPVEGIITNDSEYNISDILNQVRAVRKITIVSIDPIDIKKPGIEYHKIKIKFVTRGEPKQDLEQFKKDILSSDLSKTDLRIPGVKSVKFKEETLKRL